MFVEKELFVIQDGDNFILHAPTKLIAVAVTSGVVHDLQSCEVSGEYPEGLVRDALLETGILSENPVLLELPNTPEAFIPTSVTLFPTSDCGLRCVYCYASAGMTAKVMEFSVAKAAVDLIIKNALMLSKKTVSVSFHGGGEPLYGESGSLVRDIVTYAKDAASSRGIKVSFSCATNGVLSVDQLVWARDNINRLNLSVDGPPEIQDAQRPLKTGDKSSVHVERTLAFLEENEMNYGIRATITESSVGRLTEIVEYLHRVAPSVNVHLEPLFSCGRCSTTGIGAPDPSVFVDAFLSARVYAKTLGVELYNSGATVDRFDEHFCGATSGNFCVTPWGDVTSCYEVSVPSDDRAPLFFFGAYDQGSQAFSFDERRLIRLRERRVSNIPTCGDCFMKYACAGDCPAKSATMTGSLNGGFRCVENRTLGANDIVKRIQQGKEVIINAGK